MSWGKCRSATEILRANIDDEPQTNAVMWKGIVEYQSDNNYRDDDEFVVKLHAEWEVIIHEAKTHDNEIVITVAMLDDGVNIFERDKASGRDDLSADVLKHSSEDDKIDLVKHFNEQLTGLTGRPETLKSPICISLPKLVMLSSSNNFELLR